MTINRLLKKTFLLVGIASFSSFLHAQSTSDAVMMKPGEICVDANYSHNGWDHYWEGDSLRDNGNIGTLNTHTISGMIMLGLVNRVNLLASVPDRKSVV